MEDPPRYPVHANLRPLHSILLLGFALVIIVVSVGLATAVPVGNAVSVAQDANRTTVQPGDRIGVEITLNATGHSSPAIDASLPSGWNVVGHRDDGGSYRASENQWIWFSSGTYTIQYTVEVPNDATGGSYTLSAEGSALNEDGSVEIDSTSTTINVSAPTAIPSATPAPTPKPTSSIPKTSSTQTVISTSTDTPTLSPTTTLKPSVTPTPSTTSTTRKEMLSLPSTPTSTPTNTDGQPGFNHVTTLLTLVMATLYAIHLRG